MDSVGTNGLLVAGAVLVLVVAALSLAIRHLARDNARREKALLTMQQDLRALCNAAVTVGDRVNRLELQMREVSTRQEQLGVRQDRIDSGSGDDRSYDQAIKMAKKGASVEDLVEVCGLARGEAELIAMMHRLSA